MSDIEIKPLNWKPEPGIGYTVERRSDGGMNVVFTDSLSQTIAHWRQFSLEHLYDSDRLTRNLYDLRQIEDVSEDALRFAMEVNTDPSVRNIRLAVVVSSPKVRQSLVKLADLTAPGGVDMALFSSIDEAEAWLNRPLTLV